MVSTVLSSGIKPAELSRLGERSQGGIVRPRRHEMRRMLDGGPHRLPCSIAEVRPLEVDWQIPTTRRGKFEDSARCKALLDLMEKACLDNIREKLFGVDDLARQLGVHPKFLQRTLGRLGTSFQEIRDWARWKNALAVMVSDNPRMNDEIAEALGFSSAASFSRAIKRRTGVSPVKRHRNGTPYRRAKGPSSEKPL